MFKATQHTKHIFARVKLSDGRQLDGKFIVSETTNLLACLNDEGKFAVFVSHEGDTRLIAKSMIIEANEKAIKKITPLSPCNDNGFDPYKILGVSTQAPFETIQEQYNMLAQRYHPAQYTGKNRAPEIIEYADSMSKLIEQAFQALATNNKPCDQKVAS